MNYEDIFLREKILSNIPLGKEGYDFPTTLATSLILMQVACQSKMKEYESFMQEALSKLKPEGFDERANAARLAESVEKQLAAHEEWDGKGEQPPKPTEEELNKAAAAREAGPAFQEELAALEAAYAEARTTKGQECVNGFSCILPREKYELLVSTIGTVGNIPVTMFDGVEREIPKVQLLSLFATYFLE